MVLNSDDEEFEDANKTMNADRAGTDLSGLDAAQVEITSVSVWHDDTVELTVSTPDRVSVSQPFRPAELRRFRDAWDVNTIQEFDGQYVLVALHDDHRKIVGPVTEE